MNGKNDGVGVCGKTVDLSVTIETLTAISLYDKIIKSHRNFYICGLSGF